MHFQHHFSFLGGRGRPDPFAAANSSAMFLAMSCGRGVLDAFESLATLAMASKMLLMTATSSWAEAVGVVLVAKVEGATERGREDSVLDIFAVGTADEAE
jgi:hypothetical protein